MAYFRNVKLNPQSQALHQAVVKGTDEKESDSDATMSIESHGFD